MDEEDNTSPTTAKTLWTETILEVLYLALEYDKPDEDIRKILDQMRGSGHRYVIDKVRQKRGEQAAARVSKLLEK